MKKILAIFIFIAAHLSAEDFPKAANQQPVHEAFVTKIADLSPQEIIAKQPPAQKAETAPPQAIQQTIWIPGYWSWMREKQDFVWICGVWRLPPPDHIWMPGYWNQQTGGWTWVRGAWIQSNDLSKLVYAKNPPPASKNEDVGTPPGSDNYWSMGYWEFDQAAQQYRWLSGSWQKFNPKWIFEAAHWIWRPEGYLFIPAYWDWPIEQRGQAFDCNSNQPMNAKAVTQQLTSCYPDYIAECNWCRHYCPDVWQGCNCLPPWWGWDDWWSLPSGDGWWLWWWYLNDGYPYPPFIIDVIGFIPPPTIVIIDVFGGLNGPIIITPNGVATIDQWIDAIRQVGGNGPFLPPDLISQITDAVQKLIPKTGKDRPKGDPNHGHVQKPTKDHTPASGSAVIPEIPNQNIHAQVPDFPQVTAPTPTTTIIQNPPIQYVPQTQIYTQPQYYPQYDPQYYPQYYPQDYPPNVYINWGNGGWDGGHHGGHGGWNGGGGGGHHGGGGGHHGGGGGGHHGGGGGGGGHHGGGGGGHHR